MRRLIELNNEDILQIVAEKFEVLPENIEVTFDEHNNVMMTVDITNKDRVDSKSAADKVIEGVINAGSYTSVHVPIAVHAQVLKSDIEIIEPSGTGTQEAQPDKDDQKADKVTDTEKDNKHESSEIDDNVDTEEEQRIAPVDNNKLSCLRAVCRSKANKEKDALSSSAEDIEYENTLHENVYNTISDTLLLNWLKAGGTVADLVRHLNLPDKYKYRLHSRVKKLRSEDASIPGSRRGRTPKAQAATVT